RNSFFDIIVNGCGILRRCIYTAVRTVVEVDGTSEAGSPARVMDTYIGIEGHPVGHCRIISFSYQCGVTLLIHNGVNSGMGIPAFVMASCDNICIHDQLSVFIKPHMLLVQADLYISISYVIGI